MPVLTNVQLCRVIGRSLNSVVKLRNKHRDFPRPKIAHGSALLWDSDAVKQWLTNHPESSIWIDPPLFDARVALALTSKAES